MSLFGVVILGFIVWAVGVRGVLIGIAIVTLYMVAAFHAMEVERHPVAASVAAARTRTCTAEETADKHNGWGPGWHPTDCMTAEEKADALPKPQASVPSSTKGCTLQASSDCAGGQGPKPKWAQPWVPPKPEPAPVAKASTQPGTGWQLIPWPADQPVSNPPSPAAQRLLERLNGWVR